MGLIAALFAFWGGLTVVYPSWGTLLGLSSNGLPGTLAGLVGVSQSLYIVLIPGFLLLLTAVVALVDVKGSERPIVYSTMVAVILTIFVANWALGVGFILGLMMAVMVLMSEKQ